MSTIPLLFPNEMLTPMGKMLRAKGLWQKTVATASVIVVVVGGMGSLRGAFVASLFVGLVDTFGKAYFPGLALFLIYLLMVIVLLTRPQGLFGVGKA